MNQTSDAVRDVMIALGFGITDDLADMEIEEEAEENG